MELIIIKTANNTQDVKQALEEKHISYEIMMRETITEPEGEWNEAEWRQAVRLASQDQQRKKEIAAWDKIASKVKE